MRRHVHAIIPLATVILLFSCACNRKADKSVAQYYSGIFRVDDSGEAYFTDCATRLRMELSGEGHNELMRHRYDLEEAADGEPVLVTFYGRLVRPQPLVASDNISGDTAPYPLTDLELSIDSLLSVAKTAGCASDFMVPGIYRKVHDGETRILRLRPDYTFSIENFTDGPDRPLQQGTWYRTSEVTLQLQQSPEGPALTFQILPVRQSLAATGAEGSDVYEKVWL